MGKEVSQEELEKRRQHIKQWKDSGVSKMVYCRWHEISHSTFRYWIGYENKKLTSQPSTQQLRIIPIIRQSLQQTESHTISGVQLRHSNGWQVSLPSSVSAPWLANLLRQLS